MKLIRKNHLPGHGQGPFYSWRFWRFRFSLGGYGWNRKWYQIRVKRYFKVATHFQFGPTCFSVLTGHKTHIF